MAPSVDQHSPTTAKQIATGLPSLMGFDFHGVQHLLCSACLVSRLPYTKILVMSMSFVDQDVALIAVINYTARCLGKPPACLRLAQNLFQQSHASDAPNASQRWLIPGTSAQALDL